MSATKALAFVLKKQDYRDTSLLVDLYTREYGRVRGIVKGVRDSRARFGSTFEPFSLNEILFYRRRKGAGDLHLVTQAELVELYPVLREDLDRFATACYCMELLSELVEADESSPEIFRLIQDTLSFLSSGASVKRAARIFEVKLFEQLGLMPEVKVCVFCRTEPKEGAYFNQALGGIHCKDCGQKQKQLLGGTSLPVSRGALQFLDHVRRSPVAELYSVKVSQEVGAELEKVLRRFTDFHLSHKLKTLTFMEKTGIS
jgi:DNA repair protein RecO (recombination protein O)